MAQLPHDSSAFEIALPQVRRQEEPVSHLSPLNLPPTITAQNSDFDQLPAGRPFHQSAVSPVGPGDDIRWVPETKQWESRTPYMPSPQLAQAILSGASGKQSTSNIKKPPETTPTNLQAQGTIRTPLGETLSSSPQKSMPQEGARNQDVNNQESQTNNSFYWHSPHSSSDTTNEHSQTFSGPTTPSNDISASQILPTSTNTMEQTRDSTYSQTTNMYSSDLGLYSASALGFGGPSDWEHFGDYEAEEVDDTELYSRVVPSLNEPVSADFAELPADTLPPSGVEEHKSVDATDTVFVKHDSESLSMDSVKTRTSSSATEDAPSQEESAKQNHELPPNHLQMHVERFSLSETDNPGLPSESLCRDSYKIEATMDEALQTWPQTPSLQARRSFSPPASDQSSPMKSTSEVDTPMHSDHSKPSSKSESPLQHAQSAAKISSVQPTAAIESHHPGHDVPLNENQVSLKHADSLNLEKASRIQEDGLDVIPPLRVGAPFVSEAIREQGVNQGAGTVVATPLPPSNTQDQQTLQQDWLETSEKTVQSRLVVATSPSLPSKKIEASDPYANLDAWAKASLNRYVAMLREEVRAETDKDKFKIFEVFINRETRLRAVLYGTDPEATTEKSPPLQGIPAQYTNTTNLVRASKALPALPTDADTPPPKPPASTVVQDTTSGRGKSLKLPTGNQSYVMVESSDDVQYSPGGRPKVPRASNTEQGDVTAKNKQESTSEVPNVVGADGTPDSQKPAYTPFRYSQPDATDISSKRQSYRPYAALKIGSLGIGPKTSIHTDDPRISGIDSSEKIFISSSQDDHDTANKKIGGSEAPTNQYNTQEPLDLRRFETADFDPLVSVLPQSGFVLHDSTSLQDLKSGMDAVPDDFSFIHQSVVAWDAKAKKLRENHEKARHARQVESEQRIDALFDDHEIGYGDISELESEFKRSEAATKADEDRLDYQTFVTEVFDIVWTRLHFEIDQLTPLYDQYTDLLNDTLTGKDMFEGSSNRFALAPTMDSLLNLHQKLEVRHQKAFEAVLERDRRLKKTELSPWYSLGNVTKVKQLEKQFEQAEKNAIVEYCRQRDVRANKLMDALDQNTLRGVGANQDYMELIHRAVSRVASQRAFASAPNSNNPDVGLEEVTKAKLVTSTLATSSEQIVQTFHVADMLLNAADYDVSVAKAKLASADLATFKRLSEEKAKEDHKLMRDLEHRLALIREDARRTNDEIVKLLCFLGVQNGHAEIPPRASGGGDPGHQERLQKALAEAKRRNAANETLV